MFYIWTEQEFIDALKRVFNEYFGGGELIYCSYCGDWEAYFADADTFAAKVFEVDFLGQPEPLPGDIEGDVLNGTVTDPYEVACEIIEANCSACDLDPWGVLHGLLSVDDEGEPRSYYDMFNDPDGLFLYLEWVDLCGRSKDDEPEWLDAYLAGVPIEDLANGLPPDGLLR